MWDQFCNRVRLLRESGSLSKADLDRLGERLEQMYEAGQVTDAQVEQFADAAMSPEDKRFIDTLAYGLAKLLNGTPINQLGQESARILTMPVDQLANEAWHHKVARGIVRVSELQDALEQMPGFVGSGVMSDAFGRPLFEVLWLRGYPPPALPEVIEKSASTGNPGIPTKLVMTDSLPIAYG